MVRRAKTKQKSRAIGVEQTDYGLGVFARRVFSAGQTISEIKGEVIADTDYGSDYCIDLGGGEVLEPAAPFRYLNHSCQPNCEIVGRTTWDDAAGALRHVTWVRSLGIIAPGEQLTIDYAWPASCAIPCMCGSENCRGWIVAEDQVDDVADRPPPQQA